MALNQGPNFCLSLLSVLLQKKEVKYVQWTPKNKTAFAIENHCTYLFFFFSSILRKNRIKNHILFRAYCLQHHNCCYSKLKYRITVKEISWHLHNPPAFFFFLITVTIFELLYFKISVHFRIPDTINKL